ncbi:J domain-containing protein DDB_G0295729 isoform X2 [Cryptotermes secundus]|nr:J domain-containing protein DDB_G0295729 isoform X2 [Cryptotermes secundus]
MAEAEDEAPSILLPCTICNRTFKPKSLEKHSKICEKNAAKKRKTFDSSKQRIQGLAEFLPVIPKKTEMSPIRKSQSAWKEKHLEFVRAVRQARGVSEGHGKRSLPSAVAQSRPAVHEKCPHCERNFGPKAFDRHIEWCKEQKARIPKSPASIQAKERLEARTKYRAPLAMSKRTLTREKYSPLHGGGIREPSPISSGSSMNCSTISLSSSGAGQTITASAMPSIKTSTARSPGSAPSSRRNIAKECSSSSPCGLQNNNNAPSPKVQRSNGSPSRSVRHSNGSQRNSMTRRNIQQRSSSPTKRISLKKVGAVGKDESVTEAQLSQKQNSADENVQDIFSSSCNITCINPVANKLTGSVLATVPVVAVSKNKSKKIEVKSDSITSEETYDPYVSAERQMMELLSHGNCPEKEKKQRKQQQQQQQQQKQQQQQQAAQVKTEQAVQLAPVSSISPAPHELRTSPTSAFTKYSSVKPKTDIPLTMNRSAPDYHSFDSDALIVSGHNTGSPPSLHNVSVCTSTSQYDENSDNINNNRDFTISLSNLSLCSVPDFDFNLEFDINMINQNSNRSKKYRKKLENAALALQRSVSLYHPGPTTKDEIQLEIDDVDNSLLHISEIEGDASPLRPVSSFSLSSLHPKPVTTSSLPSSQAAVNSEELSDKLEASKLHGPSKKSAMILHAEDEFASEDNHINYRSTGSKISGDSAYSSLNRKSPLADVNSQGLERHSEVTLDADHQCLSSSGSESSLPPLFSLQVERNRSRSPLLTSSSPPVIQSNLGQQPAPRMSKFCHECGSKYPVTVAKFCCECGVKRLLF